MNFKILSFILLFLGTAEMASSQNLNVELSPDGKKVDMNTSEGVSTVVFKSNVKGLRITNDWNDDFTKYSDDLFSYRIEPYKDSIDAVLNLPVYPRRKFILESPKSSMHEEELEEILPNHVYYYTVTLPDNFSKNLSVEYLFSKTAKHGFRVSYGKRYGVYLSYLWGDYIKYGSDMAEVSEDCDVTKAKMLGHIRTSITGGARVGLYAGDSDNFISSLYMLLGAGYGEYGRQWENQWEVERNIYFHSDYIKGAEAEAAVQCVLYDWLVFSAGANFLIGDGKISVDSQIGLGLNLNLSKLLKHKKYKKQ